MVCLAGTRRQMIYQVHILERHGTGTVRIIGTRTHSARSDLEAIRIVEENLHVSAPTASGFSLRRRDGDLQVVQDGRGTAPISPRGEGRRKLPSFPTPPDLRCHGVVLCRIWCM